MRFTTIHDVTLTDVARAARLTTRPTEIVLGIVVVVVLSAILANVVYALSVYLWAVFEHPQSFVDLLLRSARGGNAVMAWLSIIVTLGLPVFLFFALRSLGEAIWPSWRVRRVIKSSDMLGPTTYTVDDDGVRAIRSGGTDTFHPWTSFDGMRYDEQMAVLMLKGRPLFFVPLAAFSERNDLLAHIKARVTDTHSPKG